MAWTRVASIAIGGICAAGFVDDSRVAIGSHSGLGTFDARTGRRLLRAPDEDYGWYRDQPPTILVPSLDGVLEVTAAGIWGGALTTSIADGWTCSPTPDGAVLTAAGQPEVTVRDPEELRVCGFSPNGRVFIHASSPTLTILARPQPAKPAPTGMPQRAGSTTRSVLLGSARRRLASL